MRFGFVTCVQLGLSCMEAIYDISGKLNLVITLNDDQSVSKSGRVYLDDFCTDKGIELFKTTHINNLSCLEIIRKHKIDWLFIIGWSQVASIEVLNTPTMGALGIHPTLLPVGRGRAAIPWAILKSLDKTGVTLFKLDQGIDTGEIIEQEIVPLSISENATILYDKVNQAHVSLIRNAYPKLLSQNIVLTKQDENKATVWVGRKPEDGEINIDGTIEDAEKLVRAVTRPYPGAYYVSNNVKIIIWKAAVSKSRLTPYDLKFCDLFLNAVEYDLYEL